MNFYFMRHGLAFRTLEGVCAGTLPCSGLTPAGLEAVVRKIKSLPRFDHVISSPIRRARETAAQIQMAHEISPLWREREYGAWEGLPFSLYEARLRNHETPLDGESHADLLTRLKKALGELRERSGTTLVVSHGGVWQGLHDLLGVEAPWIEPADLYQVDYSGSQIISQKII